MKIIDREKIINKDIEDKTNIMFSISEFDMGFHNNLFDIEELDKKTIFAIERIVRNSYEYRNYIRYLKEELDLTRCSLIENMDSKTLPISLEFHHYPFTLYDLTDIVGRKLITEKAEIGGVSLLDIAYTVIEEHFKGHVGLVPLSKTLHQMAHNGAIIVPIDKVNGNYRRFIKNYFDFIDQDSLKKINAVETHSISEDAKEINRKKLKKDVVQFVVEYEKEVHG